MANVTATCPVSADHDRFVTTAHVAQAWVVNSTGTFIEVLADLETTRDPDPGNTWTCQRCGTEAVVTAT